jgi:hypothetical protein
VRTLAIANLIEEAAVSEAIEALEAADLLETRSLQAAAQAETQKAAEDKEFFGTGM